MFDFFAFGHDVRLRKYDCDPAKVFSGSAIGTAAGVGAAAIIGGPLIVGAAAGAAAGAVGGVIVDQIEKSH